jgi:tRNA splicing endonuclease
VTAIGSCSVKVATRGKAAAVPVLLTDEDLYTCLTNKWVRLVDAAGAHVDADSALAQNLSILPTAEAREGQMLRRAVHADLTLKGYAMTNGIKFGVDFLAYKGDPTSVHAAFMVIVGREGQGIAPLDLVARSRVATTALKMAVMAWASISSAPHATATSPRPSVTYAVFKRMGPGTAIFADSAAQQAGQAEYERHMAHWQRQHGQGVEGEAEGTGKDGADEDMGDAAAAAPEIS